MDKLIKSDFLISLENLKSKLNSKGYIALVDDDEAQRQLIQKTYTLAQVNHEFSMYESGEEFLHAMDRALIKGEALPDLIFLDINMPVLSGFDILNFMKKDRILKSVSVIMLSGSDNVEDIEKAYALAANGYYPKPSNFRDYISLFEGL